MHANLHVGMDVCVCMCVGIHANKGLHQESLLIPLLLWDNPSHAVIMFYYHCFGL